MILQTARLTIELQVTTPSSVDDWCGLPLRVPVMARFRTADGLIDVRPTRLSVTDQYPYPSAVVELQVPGLPAHYLVPRQGIVDPYDDRLRATQPEPTLVVRLVEFGARAELVVNRDQVVGLWSSHIYDIPRRPPPPYQVPPVLETECAIAADFTDLGQYTPFASAAEFSAALVGNWIRCRDVGGAPHEGLQVRPDGAWRDATWESDRFVARGGLLHEGIVNPPRDASQGRHIGLFQMDVIGGRVARSGRLWGDRLMLHGSGSDQGTYVRTDRPFVERPVPFRSRQRAGASACSGPEEGIIELTDPLELDRILTGEWTLCSGDLVEDVTKLRFDGRGGVQFSYSGESQPSFKTYRVFPLPSQAGGFRHSTLVFDETRPHVPGGVVLDWLILVSDRPLKLWLMTPSAGDHYYQAVFSAVD